MTPSQFRQALETLAFNDRSRMTLQLNSGQVISGRFQTLLTNGDMVWFTEEHDEGKAVAGRCGASRGPG